MKKIITVTLVMFMLVIGTSYVKAACNDSALNDLVETIEIKYSEDTAEMVTDPSAENYGEYDNYYAYYLVITPYSDKYKIEVTNNLYGGKKSATYNKRLNAYVVGSFTDYSEKIYTISIYGNSKTSCSNQLLRTITYRVEPFNKYSLYAYCDNNKDEEICQTMKDTSKVSQEEVVQLFEKKAEEKKEQENPGFFKAMLNFIKKYILFILIPIVLVSAYFVYKMAMYKKEVQER